MQLGRSQRSAVTSLIRLERSQCLSGSRRSLHHARVTIQSAFLQLLCRNSLRRNGSNQIASSSTSEAQMVADEKHCFA